MENIRCSTLLVKASQYHIMYGDRLANHLPMALTALDKMGAADSRLQDFFQYYIQKLIPLETSHRDRPVNPRDYLGNSSKFPNFLEFYRRQLAETSTEIVLKKGLPDLIPGLGASAFHAMIRLAYALETESKEEVAHSLAYWAAEYLPLGRIDERIDVQPGELIKERFALTGNYNFAPGIIVDRMQEVAQMKGFNNEPHQPHELSLEKVAKLAVQAYLLTDDFTLLHGVTGCSAFRILQPYLLNKETALRYFWQAFIVAYLTTKKELKAENREKAKKDIIWEPLLKKACESYNDHVIKMVYTCWSEYKIKADADYFEAALKVLKWDEK